MYYVKKLKISILDSNKSSINNKYDFIRKAQYAQYLALNKSMSYLASSYFKNKDLSDILESKKLLTNTNQIFDDINFGKGIDSKSLVIKRVKKDFDTDLKKGLAKGEISVRNYKRYYPLLTKGRNLNLYYNNNNIEIKWVNHIVFKVILGKNNNKSDSDLRGFLKKIIEGEYTVAESGIYFDNNKLMLNLTVKISQKSMINSIILDRVVGVDLGLRTPAYLALSDNHNISKAIGNYTDCLNVKKQFIERRHRLEKQQSITPQNKLLELESLRQKEKNFTRPYNHFVSKSIIDFAKKHKAGQINIELLALRNTLDSSKATIIRYWGYYQLQSMIKYKAKHEGISVRYIDPYLTSQTCSQCGNYTLNQRIKDRFNCKSCGFTSNSDKNAAINIAKSKTYK